LAAFLGKGIAVTQDLTSRRLELALVIIDNMG
jgi:hypothetical protein